MMAPASRSISSAFAAVRVRSPPLAVFLVAMALEMAVDVDYPGGCFQGFRRLSRIGRAGASLQVMGVAHVVTGASRLTLDEAVAIKS
jgi:hypothetical protein